MLISEKQHEANRQNAQHSSGPMTEEGKPAIRFNALTFGLRTRATVLQTENVADYYRLCNELDAEWQPQTRTERCYVETMVTSQWLLARVARSEQKVYMEVGFGERQLPSRNASKARKPGNRRLASRPNTTPAPGLYAPAPPRSARKASAFCAPDTR